MAKEKIQFPNPRFFKAKDNIDWKAQGKNLMEVMGIFGEMLGETDWSATAKSFCKGWVDFGKRAAEEYNAFKASLG